jgi:group I intron endonuclease
MYKLYKITNTVNGKLYIGITKLPIQQRWAKHLKDSLFPKYPLHHAINKHGKENFIIELLEESIDRAYISNLEEPLILIYNSRNNGYNVAKGGYGGDLGPEANNKRKHTVKNLSQAKKQEWSNNLSKARLGAKHSIQTKEKLSQLQKDRGGYGPKSHSAITKEKISNGNKGKIRSEIARQNYKKSAKIRGTGPQLQGNKVGCLCCNKEWDLGNFTKHIRKKNEFQ